jgi:predicted Zn-dependent protease
VQTVPACRSRFELILGDGLEAGSDGRVVHLGEKFFDRFTDEEIAVIVAHELAHTVLRHRERLDVARVNRGLLREVGRNGRLFRQTERDADELGVHLLNNAGYDPFAAARFWRTHGGGLEGGFFRARTHPSSGARAAAAEATALSLVGSPRPSIPAILRTREVPLR